MLTAENRQYVPIMTRITATKYTLSASNAFFVVTAM